MSESPEAKSIYFELAVKFFHEYRWIYDFKATRIFADNVLQNVPSNFQEYFSSLSETSERFREILTLKDQDDWPSGISKFIKECTHLRKLSEKLKNASVTADFAPFEPGPLNSPSKMKLPKKWNLKKYCEVAYVGNFVGWKCKLENCDAVIDIGSGLGYLSRHISSEFELPVIGIESDPSRVQTATNTGTSSTLQTYFCLKISERISQEIGPLVEKYNTVCITALHACGDLSPWSLKHFVNTYTCKMVAVVPCCYHKMSLETENFPMSCSLNGVLMQYEDIHFLKNQWLWRLASQRSGDKFLDDIKKETTNLLFRALVEKVCVDENLFLKRRKRNLHDNKFETFDEYLEKTLGVNGGFELYKEDRKINEAKLLDVQQLMLLQHDKLSSWSCILTGILALQGAMQKVAEDIILIDRVAYLGESGEVKESGLIRVIPEDVSPRGMVLFATKK